MKNNTLVINLLGGSGAGKSKNAGYIFYKLKEAGIECELVTEYVKDMVWEGRSEIFNCQPYIFGKQLYKLQRVNGKVDVIVTDRPVCLDAVYDPEQDENFKKYILKKFNQFNNLNIFLVRGNKFSPNGRNESSIEDAKKIDNLILDFLDDNNIPYIKIEDSDLGRCGLLKIIETKMEDTCREKRLV